ncbi:cadherin repeat domain-containing protein [Candidatus Woesearchaeota archaeon]|nr:cadherin repeat domain-containing protein [Candidatus Woesearchaeota archaeon]
MKRLGSLIFIILLLINIASAERFVNYNLREGLIDENGNFRSTNNPLNYVNVIGYTCLNRDCSQLGNKIFDNQVLNSESSSSIQLRYPTNLQSNYGYAVYYYKDGYITWESNPNWFGTDLSDPQGPFNVYLSKKEVCSSNIEEFSIVNSQRTNTPVVVSVKAGVDLTTKAAIENAGPLKAIPSELKGQYSVKTIVTLTVLKDNKIEFFNEKYLIIGYGNSENVRFSFTPTKSGDYRVLATTKIVDKKCLGSQANSAEKRILVLEENPTNMCYTKLGDLETNNDIRAGGILNLGFTKISNLQTDQNNVEPIKTKIEVELKSKNGVPVFNEVVFLNKNKNTVDTEKENLILNIPKDILPGFYEINIKASGNDLRCGNNNKEDTENKYITILKKNFLNKILEIITQPITSAELNKLYVYDVNAVDANGNDIEYSLLSGPYGMSIDKYTGVITWFVDANKFSKEEKYNVIIVANDGFFFDVQMFSIIVNGRNFNEKNTNTKHKFKFDGMQLETSSVKEGIQGFLLLKNEGSFKEKKVSVSAKIYDLDIYEELISNLNLGKRDSFWVPLDIKLPQYTKEGEYLLNIQIGNSDHTEERVFVVYITRNMKEEKVIKRNA